VIDALRTVPTTAWVCALIACLNAVCWSVISPPFQVPDEPSHFAYVQRLAETGSFAMAHGEVFPSAEQAILKDLHNTSVLEHPAVGTISSEAAQRKLENDLALPYERMGSADAGVAASEPPLYYALETIPYGLASSGTVLDRLAMMRLLSALMGGLTAFFAYLFLREALPAVPWAWTVGGLGVALMPLLGMMSGAVNPDALLFAVSAALFYCLARGFRRGITPWLAAALGAVLAIGFMTKLNFLGLLPGALLGLLALCVREARTSRQSAYRCLGLALGVGVSPILLYICINVLSGKPAVGVVADALARTGAHGSILKEISYIWQFYLPRLPGMKHYFHGFPTTRVDWFNGMVGLYGWLDTAFPRWVYDAALIPAGAIAVLFANALVKSRYALRTRVVELFVYLAMSLGVLLIIGADDYLHNIPGEYAEPRYVLPMLALWGAVLALAARGAGRRWGPIAGVLIVCLALAHNIFSQLLVISRYYG
jgi:4-amino-4-deoxy-L-arabinose transferase-like glycosyltransferase